VLGQALRRAMQEDLVHRNAATRQRDHTGSAAEPLGGLWLRVAALENCKQPLTCGDVRPLGFEPRTCGLRVRCSAIELEALVPSDQVDNGQGVATHPVTLGEMVEGWPSE
jgi:hypothetical protein